jgi:hypothetical protein
MNSLYVGLVHYPVFNKNGETIQTSVTNLDIHDIARSALTFGVKTFYVLTPDTTQKDFVHQVIRFWQSDSGQTYNRNRSAALSTIQITDSVESAIQLITMQEEMQPLVISTTARSLENQITFEKVRDFLNQKRPVLLLFGTGYGLTETIHQDADFVLQPVKGIGDYNHLSVRSAVAIVLDRITSRCI